VQARGLALVEPAVDAVAARGTPLPHGRRAENIVVGTVPIQDAAVGIPLAVTGGTALVHPVHRLADEVLGEVAGVRQRPVVAAGPGGPSPLGRAPRGVAPAVLVVRGARAGLV